MKEVILAIKPKYAKAILDGTKTVELRKRFPSDVDKIFLYATAPTKAIIGRVDVKKIVHKPLKDIWDIYHNKVGITEQEFQEYFGTLFSKCGWGIAIEVDTPIKFLLGIERHRLKSEFGVESPQSYCYANLSEKIGIEFF
jgi:predicted transcriptional regulator